MQISRRCQNYILVCFRVRNIAHQQPSIHIVVSLTNKISYPKEWFCEMITCEITISKRNNNNKKWIYKNRFIMITADKLIPNILSKTNTEEGYKKVTFNTTGIHFTHNSYTLTKGIFAAPYLSRYCSSLVLHTWKRRRKKG